MNPIRSGNKSDNKLPPVDKKPKGKDLKTVVSKSLERSDSDSSVKMERSYSSEVETTPEKTSKRSKIKGLARKIIAPISKVKNQSGLVSGCSIAVDKTYAGSDKGIADLARSDKALGCIYVVDGSGHNDPRMRKDLEHLFANFDKAYKSETKRMKFADVEEAKAHVCGYMNGLHQMIHDMVKDVNAQIANGNKEPFGMSFTSDAGDTRILESGKLPAMSFGQVVKIADQAYFITAQYGDTSFVIQRDGTSALDFSLVDTEHDHPLGKKGLSLSDVRVTPLNSGDRILACSDGIMEFMQASEFQEIALEHPQADATELLAAFKDRVIKNGEKLQAMDDEDRMTYLKETTSTKNIHGLLGANQRTLKTHNPEDRKFVDDISLAIMTVN